LTCSFFWDLTAWKDESNLVRSEEKARRYFLGHKSHLGNHFCRTCGSGGETVQSSNQSLSLLGQVCGCIKQLMPVVSTFRDTSRRSQNPTSCFQRRYDGKGHEALSREGSLSVASGLATCSLHRSSPPRAPKRTFFSTWRVTMRFQLPAPKSEGGQRFLGCRMGCRIGGGLGWVYLWVNSPAQQVDLSWPKKKRT